MPRSDSRAKVNVISASINISSCLLYHCESRLGCANLVLSLQLPLYLHTKLAATLRTVRTHLLLTDTRRVKPKTSDRNTNQTAPQLPLSSPVASHATGIAAHQNLVNHRAEKHAAANEAPTSHRKPFPPPPPFVELFIFHVANSASEARISALLQIQIRTICHFAGPFCSLIYLLLNPRQRESLLPPPPPLPCRGDSASSTTTV